MNRPAPRARPTDAPGLESFAFIAGIGAVVVGLVVWATGEIAGFVSSGKWIRVHPGQLGGVLVKLVGSPGDPAHAWPRPARHVLPGPVLFYVVLAAARTSRSCTASQT